MNFPKMGIRNWSDYKRYIRNVIIDYGFRNIIVGEIPLSIVSHPEIPKNIGGVILTRAPGLRFKDGAHLTFRELVKVENETIISEVYTYHYERPGGYFFRYEKEPTENPLRKPEFHLHVILDVPHFNAPCVNLEKVLQLVEVNFYSNHDKLLGTHIELTV